MIELERDGAFWTVTLNRPDKANALTGAMLMSLAEIFASARTEARVLVVTGAGQTFSAGADLKEARAGLATSDVWEKVSGALASFDGISIAALNGTAAGGSLGMVLACDFRVAVPGAAIFYPVMKLGFLPQPSDPARLAALVGRSRAKRILLAGERVPVEHALDWGLVDRLVARADLMPTAREMSAHAMSAPREVLAGIKALTQTDGEGR